MKSDPTWLLIIDPQRIFADPSSAWAAPEFDAIVDPIRALAAHFDPHTILTRWVPGKQRPGSWQAYFERWPFADRQPQDPWFDVVDELADLPAHTTLDAATFGKYGPELTAITGPTPRLVLTGVATDCCVTSTALAAADDGATVQVVTDACAGSTPENQAAALQVMGLYSPQIELVSSAALLGQG